MFRRLASFVCGIVLLAGVAAADTTTKLSMAELRSKGIDPRNFSVFHVAKDGRTILAADEPDFTIKKKGILRRLWLIELTPAMKIDKVQKYDLPIPKIEQANFTPDLQSVLISSKRGSDIHKLNLEDGALSVFSTHTPDTAGFRIHSDIFSVYGGKMYTVGYFYDAQDVTGPDVMAEINLNSSGAAAFTQVVDVAAIQSQLKGLRVESLLSPQGMFFYTVDAATSNWTVWRWSQPKGLDKMDEGTNVPGSWGEGPLGVYCITKASGNEVTLANAQTGQKTPVYAGPDLLVNPCLSKEGNTVVLGQSLSTNVVDYWAAQDTDGFKLRKIAEKLPACTIRVSHDGQVVCLYQGLTGITLIKLEQPK